MSSGSPEAALQRDVQSGGVDSSEQIFDAQLILAMWVPAIKSSVVAGVQLWWSV